MLRDNFGFSVTDCKAFSQLTLYGSKTVLYCLSYCADRKVVLSDRIRLYVLDNPHTETPGLCNTHNLIPGAAASFAVNPQTNISQLFRVYICRHLHRIFGLAVPTNGKQIIQPLCALQVFSKEMNFSSIRSILFAGAMAGAMTFERVKRPQECEFLSAAVAAHRESVMQREDKTYFPLNLG